jgi:hypothetical protein
MWTLTTARHLVRKAADGGPLWDGTGWYDDTLVHSPGGWRICGRICRITWWTGNPSVNEGIPGVKFDLTTTVLRRSRCWAHRRPRRTRQARHITVRRACTPNVPIVSDSLPSR